MDNSPKFRRGAAKAMGGYVGLLERDLAADARSLTRARRFKAFVANNTAAHLRAGRLAAAIRRLNYKRDEAKGNG